MKDAWPKHSEYVTANRRGVIQRGMATVRGRRSISCRPSRKATKRSRNVVSLDGGGGWWAWPCRPREARCSCDRKGCPPPPSANASWAAVDFFRRFDRPAEEAAPPLPPPPPRRPDADDDLARTGGSVRPTAPALGPGVTVGARGLTSARRGICLPHGGSVTALTVVVPNSLSHDVVVVGGNGAFAPTAEEARDRDRDAAASAPYPRGRRRRGAVTIAGDDIFWAFEEAGHFHALNTISLTSLRFNDGTLRCALY
mmetsp:Transcript_24944/g.46164  ORF Transcript_24944/g.46164 Transcript_24944/m.46164 type:complete len:255 (-) Transcript_24944:2664-3428(-)